MRPKRKTADYKKEFLINENGWLVIIAPIIKEAKSISMYLSTNTLRGFALILFFLLTSCSGNTSIELTPASISMHQVTPIHTSTQTEFWFPVPTPLPTINTENVVDVMVNFLKDNGGCQLPCILGLTPRVSSLISINSLTDYFQKNKMKTEKIILGQSKNETSGRVFLIFRESDERIFTDMSYYYNETGELDTLTFTARSGFINTPSQQGDFYTRLDGPFGLDLLQYYSLQNILTLYGRPSNILIASFPTDPNRPHESYPFTLILFYKEKGFLAEYISQRETEGDYFLGCQPTSYISIASWSPDEQKSLLDAVARMDAQGGVNTLNLDFFKDLEEVTDFTIPEFYETFQSIDDSKCVSTPKELWPEPILNP